MSITIGYHLAQINVSWLLQPLDHPDNDDFRAALDPVNLVADGSQGFVWRMATSYGDATDIRAYDDPLILVNVSVWETLADLQAYVLGGAHLEVMRKRRTWFRRPPHASLALWWIPIGHIPMLAEAVKRLEHLRVHGETEYAFTMKKAFAAPMSE